jgi:hypothetical protein
VVLEVPQLSRTSSPNQRISSHVLCNHGNEIFMHSLNCSGKSNLEERPSVESSIEKLSEYRTEVIFFLLHLLSGTKSIEKVFTTVHSPFF